jgi:hypothetical protein
MSLNWLASKRGVDEGHRVSEKIDIERSCPGRSPDCSRGQRTTLGVVLSMSEPNKLQSCLQYEILTLR